MSAREDEPESEPSYPMLEEYARMVRDKLARRRITPAQQERILAATFAALPE